MRYPAGWHVTQKTRGVGVRLTMNRTAGSAADTNRVSVIVQSAVSELPPLDVLATQVSSKLKQLRATTDLRSAKRTTLAGRPALDLMFSDSSVKGHTDIREVVGRTAHSRPLLVTITLRRPLTGSERRALAAFVTGIDAAQP
jgi:hypothetical protein